MTDCLSVILIVTQYFTTVIKHKQATHGSEYLSHFHSLGASTSPQYQSYQKKNIYAGMICTF